ncbi:HNH endonuclease signature motif containing protein [Nocardioides gilvus]|uniref:HNH endonuclease signature motif containing protein n=1 Tax=Nocardioides gilvus TaxID=1735589 RepID=UPI0013A5857C|nr:HNH endonuclease signature motif containing protein [Nocardioides gilvus]
MNPTFMTLDDKACALRSLVEVETRLVELRLRVLSAADDVADAEGFRSAGAWLSHHTRLRRSDAAADLSLAQALDRDRPVLATAVREGRVNVAQAKVIVTALEELPTRVGVEVIAKAEAHLVGLAANHDPTELARLGRRILEVIDPERFEEEEARKLADAEQYAAEKQRLKMRALGDGTTRISGIVPDATAARLATYLHAFTNPRLSDGAVRSKTDESGQSEAEKPAFGGPLAMLGRPKQLAEAFSQLLEAFDPSRLPIHGGDATNVTVTISFADLKRDLGVATIDNGTPGDGFDTLTAAQARRLACTARIIPAVLGGDSEVLDLGRGQRLFTKAQRRALLLRDKTCRSEGCDIPGTWSEAHHLVPWSQGGVTDLENSALLCSKHHHRAHDPGYDMTRLTNGDLRFHRRR